MKLNLLKIGLAILFLICLLDMPYGYYQLIRFLGMVLFLVFAYHSNRNRNNTFAVIWLSSALLINPFIKIALGRTIWNIVDIFWAVFLFISIWADNKILNKE